VGRTPSKKPGEKNDEVQEIKKTPKKQPTKWPRENEIQANVMPLEASPKTNQSV